MSRKLSNYFIGFLCVLVIMLFCEKKANAVVKLTSDVTAKTASMSNDYITIKFNNSGSAYSLLKNGQELIGSGKGFYASINGGTGFVADSFKVITKTDNMADIAYINDWGELHYVLRDGVSGVYSYFIVSNLGIVGEFRTVYRPDGNIFRNGYTASKSGEFPTIDNIKNGTKLQDETWKLGSGQVYTKYNWADYEATDDFHGVYGNGYGMWVIPSSNEYYSGGPMRQELMVHLESSTGDAVLLNMLNGSHFGAKQQNLPSGKIYGPWLIYINNGNISDAKQRATTEEDSWPYSWLSNSSYPLNRTEVSGRLKYSNGDLASDKMVVLAKPGSNFYNQGEDYIFYSKADSNGNFNISNVRPGKYTLYAYSTSGTDSDEFHMDNVVVTGSKLNLGDIAIKSKENLKMLWNIGKADRKASEFNLGSLTRQYGLPELVPSDLTYTIGKSKESSNWYFAQTKVGKWNIDFNMDKTYGGEAHLSVPIASVSRGPVVDIYVNGIKVEKLDYSAENDQTTYRSANQSGKYRSNEIMFPANLLKEGKNEVTFDMSKVTSNGGIMYDMVKLEVEGKDEVPKREDSDVITNNTETLDDGNGDNNTTPLTNVIKTGDSRNIIAVILIGFISLLSVTSFKKHKNI
ncbi:polysaccharide lyase family protein [Clostridium sp. SHJSY1]|uniref:polysaccharide lyase family protein n=1 Tax=Clostridium sp. SHJSY1 TaxID=2942483 RepID=UPI0028759228|nr:polysaccharide lyase family protein [Clostridium sp. SHJSY1]MDS0528233.1 polysaccharide lyase family protein [Clostridium sp. SHJSY1]